MNIKVVVFGEGNSGKTTLVRLFAPAAKGVETQSREGHAITVGLDFGIHTLAGYSLHFFGTPGQPRFEFVRRVIARGAHVGILLVDSELAVAEGVPPRARVIEQEMIDQGLPHIICANKRDLPNVLPVADIQTHFQSEVLPISAKSGEGVEHMKASLTTLLETHYGESKRGNGTSG
ncbi:MAG TPA: GTP-binding protein [Gammaproteobacteria bacterium]|nr:GTP-binding protein [Gammaproteobacteria bacterium]